MTREDIIRMAREAGGFDSTSHGWTSWGGTQSTHFLERFAALVAAAEREACVRAVEDVEQSPNPIINMTNRLAVAAIRARGQA